MFSSSMLTRFKKGLSIKYGVFSFASGCLMKLHPPPAAANPMLWEQTGDLEFWSFKSQSAVEDAPGDAGEGSHIFPQLFLSGDGTWMLIWPWQRGCQLLVTLPFEWQLSGKPS